MAAGASDLLYSTFLGGSGDDLGVGIAVDAAGSAYVTGSTESPDFPTTAGTFDTSFNGGYRDAFVFKLNPTGSGLAYATFLGGSGDDWAGGIAVDGVGSAYVTGDTTSTDFPTTAGAFDPTFNGGYYGNAFVAKLSPSGSGLAYATFLGGSNWDEGHGIAVDGAGSAYVTGDTTSTDFPTTAGAYDTTYNGIIDSIEGADVFVAKVNPTGTGLAYATFLAGSNGAGGAGIAVDGTGSAYVAGFTSTRSAADFPTTAGAFDTSCDGGFMEAFVVKLTPTGSGLLYATCLGGSAADWGSSIAVDGAGSVYVGGQTLSSDFPTTAGAFDPTYDVGSYDTFVAKLTPGAGAPTPTPTATASATMVPTPTAASSPSPTATATPTPSGTAANVSIQPPTAFVAPSAMVTVALQAGIPEGRTLGSWTVDVTYNPTVVSIAGCSETVSTCNTSFSPNTARVVGAAATGLTGTQALASLTFRGVGTAGAASALTVAVRDFNDAATYPLATTVSHGSITVGVPPTVASISPNVGPGRGGTTITVGGSNFQTGATVSMDGRAATSRTYVSATSLTAVTPQHSRTVGDVNGSGTVTSLDALCLLRNVAALPGTTNCPTEKLTSIVDVVVSNPDGQSGTLAAGFTYQHADVNGSGSITSLDALCVLRQVAALPATPNCPAPEASPTPTPAPSATPSATATATATPLPYYSGGVGMASTLALELPPMPTEAAGAATWAGTAFGLAGLAAAVLQRRRTR
ncbi:MAG: SBBP repeat-containing protein [Chloroflexi bacterium]|nr:SBBP repeat-containing protein [Chloroflexota bacterium]